LAPLFEPGVAGGEGVDLGIRDHWHGGEVEAVEGFARRQSGFLQVTLEPSPASLHHFLFGERGQEAGGGPAFLVGRRRQRGPDLPRPALMPDSRNSPRAKSMRAASILLFASALMQHLGGKIEITRTLETRDMVEATEALRRIAAKFAEEWAEIRGESRSLKPKQRIACEIAPHNDPSREDS
jgi:hypothetical protein